MINSKLILVSIALLASILGCVPVGSELERELHALEESRAVLRGYEQLLAEIESDSARVEQMVTSDQSLVKGEMTADTTGWFFPAITVVALLTTLPNLVLLFAWITLKTAKYIVERAKKLNIE